MKSGKRKWMVAVLIASVTMSILALFTIATLGQGEAGGEGDEGVPIGALILCIAVGCVGNFTHRIKKVIKKEADKEILKYLRDNI